jgi:DNA polymerase elongation subunit (family B)
MPAAMCITALGRSNLHKAAHHLITTYNAKWVYSDTDSTYVQFEHVHRDELWNFCKHIAQEMLDQKIFPDPMVLEFEDAIYDPFFALKKKRYLWRYFKEDGSRRLEIGNKGVVLARRGGSKFFKQLYESIVESIFDNWTRDRTVEYIVDYISQCFYGNYPLDHFILTAKLGSSESYSEDTTLPAHVQLASTMIARGKRVEVNERIEYVITNRSDTRNRVIDKIEDVEYFKDHSDVLKLDYLYYIRSTCEQIDEILNVAHSFNNFMLNHSNLRLQKHLILMDIRNRFLPKFTFNE